MILIALMTTPDGSTSFIAYLLIRLDLGTGLSESLFRSFLFRSSTQQMDRAYPSTLSRMHIAQLIVNS